MVGTWFCRGLVREGCAVGLGMEGVVELAGNGQVLFDWDGLGWLERRVVTVVVWHEIEFCEEFLPFVGRVGLIGWGVWDGGLGSGPVGCVLGIRGQMWGNLGSD